MLKFCWGGAENCHLHFLTSPVGMKSENSYPPINQIFPKVEYWEYQSGLIRTFHSSEVRAFCLDKVKRLCFSFWFGSSLTRKMMEVCYLEDVFLPEKCHGLFFQASWGRRSSLESNSAVMGSFVVTQKMLKHSSKSGSSLKILSTCKDTGMQLCL